MRILCPSIRPDGILCVEERLKAADLPTENGSTFKAAANVLPNLLESDKLQTFFRRKCPTREFILPYSPAQGGAWESLIKVFKRTLMKVTDLSHRTPSFIELQTYISNTARLVNNRLLKSLSNNSRNFNAISPSSLLTPAFHPNTPVGKPHDKNDLRKIFISTENLHKSCGTIG